MTVNMDTENSPPRNFGETSYCHSLSATHRRLTNGH